MWWLCDMVVMIMVMVQCGGCVAWWCEGGGGMVVGA